MIWAMINAACATGFFALAVSHPEIGDRWQYFLAFVAVLHSLGTAGALIEANNDGA